MMNPFRLPATWWEKLLAREVQAVVERRPLPDIMKPEVRERVLGAMRSPSGKAAQTPYGRGGSTPAPSRFTDVGERVRMALYGARGGAE